MVPAGGRGGHGFGTAPPTATPRMPDDFGGGECERVCAAGARHSGTRVQWTPPEGRLDGPRSSREATELRRAGTRRPAGRWRPSARGRPRAGGRRHPPRPPQGRGAASAWGASAASLPVGTGHRSRYRIGREAQVGRRPGGANRDVAEGRLDAGHVEGPDDLTPARDRQGIEQGAVGHQPLPGRRLPDLGHGPERDLDRRPAGPRAVDAQQGRPDPDAVVVHARHLRVARPAGHAHGKREVDRRPGLHREPNAESRGIVRLLGDRDRHPGELGPQHERPEQQRQHQRATPCLAAQPRIPCVRRQDPSGVRHAADGGLAVERRVHVARLGCVRRCLAGSPPARSWTASCRS